tara:strand:+ start:368 stop:1018 length:651 start_codon:yes stop_codon:yes gene_type:complete
MTDIHEASVYTRNIFADAAKDAKAKGGQIAHVPMSDLLEAIAIDYLSPKGTRGAEVPVIVRGKIHYNKKEVKYIDDPPGAKKTFEQKKKLAAPKMPFEEFLPNIDPFYSPADDQQRILNAGFIKNYDKKDMLLLETPNFYNPTVDTLGRNAWLQCLTKMPTPKLKKDREIVIGEVIIITFQNPQTFEGPKFVKFPIEGAKVYPSTDHQHKPGRSVK